MSYTHTHLHAHPTCTRLTCTTLMHAPDTIHTAHACTPHALHTHARAHTTEGNTHPTHIHILHTRACAHVHTRTQSLRTADCATVTAHSLSGMPTSKGFSQPAVRQLYAERFWRFQNKPKLEHLPLGKTKQNPAEPSLAGEKPRVAQSTLLGAGKAWAAGESRSWRASMRQCGLAKPVGGGAEARVQPAEGTGYRTRGPGCGWAGPRGSATGWGWWPARGAEAWAAAVSTARDQGAGRLGRPRRCTSGGEGSSLCHPGALALPAGTVGRAARPSSCPQRPALVSRREGPLNGHWSSRAPSASCWLHQKEGWSVARSAGPARSRPPCSGCSAESLRASRGPGQGAAPG